MVQKKNNTKGMVGFICGLVSLIINFYGILPIVACVYSGMALKTFNNEEEKNKWMAVIGLILGILNLMWVIFYFYVLFTS